MLSAQLVLVIAAAAWSLPADPQPSTEKTPDQCMPQPPAPGQDAEECCSLPKGTPLTEDKIQIMKSCAKMYFDEFQYHPKAEAPNGGHPPHQAPAGGHPPHQAPAGGYPPHQAPGFPPGLPECLEECVFNVTGYLTPEAKLNKEKLMTYMSEEFGQDKNWKPLVEEAAKTCLESAPGDVPEGLKCRSGAVQLKMCLIRHLFKNCPSQFWKDNESCNAQKQLVDKCKNYLPPLKPKQDSKDPKN